MFKLLLKVVGIVRINLICSCSLIFSISILYATASSANCGVSDQCGYTISRNSKPVQPGCKTLDVTIHNTTAFQLAVDSSYHPSNTVGDTSGFGNLEPGATRVFSVSGVDVDGASHQDDVDTAIRYIAKHKNNATGSYDNTGAQFTIILKKDSCNSSSPELKISDYKCYYRCRIYAAGGNYWECAIGSAGYPGGQYCDVTCSGQTPDWVCKSYYNAYKSVSCNYASTSPLTNMSAQSDVASDPGLYTVGSNFDSSGNGTSEDSSQRVGTNSLFYCDQNSECGTNGDCNGGTADHNRPAKLEFYVKASPIQTLTVTFPFNAQSPIGRIMKDVIYNHLSPEYVGLLGTYYSVNPVTLQDTSIAFSTLCNSATCPQP